jgi:Cu(I)/Ag(I) efflux system membrane fusion protein
MIQSKNTWKTAAGWAIALLAGVMIGRWTGGGEETADAHEHAAGTVWTCSMHPQIRASEPGQCPLCGMDLTPAAAAESGSSGPALVRLSAEALALAQVQTLRVGASGMGAEREARLNGKVAVDERLLRSQATHLPGRIEALEISYTGASVREGQPIARLYSPALASAQEELAQAARLRGSQPGLYEAARAKLRNWKLTDAQIDALEASQDASGQFSILADVSGNVTRRMANLGDYVKQGEVLYEIADLRQVWVLFDLYEQDLAWIGVGSPIAFSFPSLPGRTFSGTIGFIDPVVDPMSRVSRARVLVQNPGGLLKPGMLAAGTVSAKIPGGGGQGLSLPKTAVLWTGKRSVVYVKRETAQGLGFEMREVVLGEDLGDRYLVRSGLEAEEEVVVRGTFTIDAAAQLSGLPSMMGGEDARPLEHPSPRIELPEAAQRAADALFGQYAAAAAALASDNWPLAQEALQAGRGQARQWAGLGASIPEAGRGVFRNHAAPLLEAWEKAASAGDLAGARAQFKPLSAHLIALAKSFASRRQPLFIQYCPMADGDAGAYWLSAEAGIANPYFGAGMLRCGETKGQIGGGK